MVEHEGQFHLEKEGEGIYKFANGNEYHGQWKDDKSHGKGKYIFKNRNTYIVIFLMGEKMVKVSLLIKMVKNTRVISKMVRELD